VFLAFQDSPEFAHLIQGGDDVHLARLFLELASDAYPDLDPKPYLARLRDIALRIRLRCRPRAKARDIVGQINWVLFVDEEIRGNQEDYYEPRNSYLNEVLDRRRGIPISLAVLYLIVAERVDLPMAGVNLPMHFMLRVEEEGDTWFVDPFHAGAVYSRSRCEQRISELAGREIILTDAMLAPCSLAVIAARTLRNLKAIHGQSRDITALLPVQRRLTALNPNDPAELRDLGILCAQMGRPGEAIDPLCRFLEICPGAAGAGEVKNLLNLVQAQVARWN
jgi:regulator of sirC expression with transglutaminase-like and TPR domain